MYIHVCVGIAVYSGASCSSKKKRFKGSSRRRRKTPPRLSLSLACSWSDCGKPFVCSQKRWLAGCTELLLQLALKLLLFASSNYHAICSVSLEIAATTFYARARLRGLAGKAFALLTMYRAISIMYDLGSPACKFS